MKDIVSIEFDGIDEDESFVSIANKVFEKCFEVENLLDKNLYVNIIFTNPDKIRQTNKEYRNVDKETDVLSFPMFEKEEILNYEPKQWQEVLGDIMISIERVQEQAKEYGHSFERELAYMMVHGFYHLMGEDHIEEADKVVMRQKEENVLSKLEIGRD